MVSENFLQQHVARSPDVLSQELGGEIVLLDLNSENYFGLDEVGTRVWKLIPETGNLEQVFKTLLAEFDVDEATAFDDLRGLIDDLSNAGLITLKPGAGDEHVR